MANENQLEKEQENAPHASKDTEIEISCLNTATRATTAASQKRSRDTDKEQNPKKRKIHEVAVYGNYRNYYNYRVLTDSNEDARLKYFKHEWFEGKDCLDVGCNIGTFTISVAKKFLCRSMVGIDIDEALVYRANKLLENTAKSLANRHRNQKSAPQVKMSNEEANKATSVTTSMENKSGTLNNGLSGEDLLTRVSFRSENFIGHMEEKPIYDTVLCLSVTKWVHLNWGDDGLIKLFAKIRNLLRPGGILILEPQPWKSYSSNHLVSEVVRRNYHEIVLRPDQFKEVLLDRIGFRSMQSITEKVESSVKGFSRPIYLLRC